MEINTWSWLTDEPGSSSPVAWAHAESYTSSGKLKTWLHFIWDKPGLWSSISLSVVINIVACKCKVYTVRWLVRKSLDVGIVVAFIENLINASVLKIEWLTGQEVIGKYWNFDYFQSLSLLVDTCRCSLRCQKWNFDFVQLWWRTGIRKKLFSIGTLKCWYLCTLMQWYSVYCTSWKMRFNSVLYSWLLTNNSVWNTVKIK